VLAVVVGLALAGCGSGASHDERTVVVSSDHPFVSLNAATVAGQAPGSTFVRGLVQAGLVSVDERGTVVPDTSFGTVEKVSDAPLTVRYTIASGVTWSDGVPVTPADLLLEWAARSGQHDEVVPVVGGDGDVSAPSDLDTSVAFLATSPALVRASATPVIEGSTLTLVYDTPVADWPTALDVNVPAHVVGRLALGPAPSPTPTAGAAPRTSAADASWAEEVTTAITTDDRAALVAISRAWRAYGEREQLAVDPTSAVTTGAYMISEVDDDRVVLVRNPRHPGPRGSVTTVVIRTDLDPLAQVSAVRSGSVDVALPLDTADVRQAADSRRLTVRHGGAAVLQLQLGEQASSPFAGDQPVRAAFLGALDLPALAEASGAQASEAVLPQVGPAWTPPGAATPAADVASPARTPSSTGRVPVRVLVDTADPTRAALVAALSEQVAAAGFVVTVVDKDVTAALWSQPGRWDAVIVPVVQEALPVSAVVSRWRSDGAADVTEHVDEELDRALDAASAQVDPAAVAQALAEVQSRLEASDVVAPLVRLPVMSVVRSDDARVSGVRPVDWSAADLTSWWAWLR